MSILSLGAGSTFTQDLRADLQHAQIEDNTLLAVRLSLIAPASLTSFFVNYDAQISESVHSVNAWILTPITSEMSIGKRLNFTVQSGTQIPRLGAFLIINREIKYLSHKEDLKGGATWSSSVKLTRVHLR